MGQNLQIPDGPGLRRGILREIIEDSCKGFLRLRDELFLNSIEFFGLKRGLICKQDILEAHEPFERKAFAFRRDFLALDSKPTALLSELIRKFGLCLCIASFGKQTRGIIES